MNRKIFLFTHLNVFLCEIEQFIPKLPQMMTSIH